ncbi:MAG: oxygenase MpaB family protein [Nocardioides sp.]
MDGRVRGAHPHAEAEAARGEHQVLRRPGPPLLLNVREHVDGIAGLLAGGANVALQLGHPAVGRGVLERPLRGRNVLEAPFVRGLSTFTYLAVALLGDDHDRERMRAAVNRSHAHVRSGPDSPVVYHAFDPELQLWVAACLYAGMVDVITRMHGPLGDTDADALYAASVRFGSTLQMREDQWPATRAEFEDFWSSRLDSLAYDAEVRAYVVHLLELRHLPTWLRLSPVGRFLVFTNRGFLPPVARERLGLGWSAAQERRLARTLRLLGRCYARLPLPLRNFPLNACLWDFRRRTRSGRPPW